jgi:hypothetical protein
MHRLTDGLAVVLLALTLLVTAQTVRAANLEEAIAHFTADDYSETDAGIGAVAASGDPRSASLSSCEVPHAAALHCPGPNAPEQHGYPGLRDRPEALHRPRSADSL